MSSGVYSIAYFCVQANYSAIDLAFRGKRPDPFALLKLKLGADELFIPFCISCEPQVEPYLMNSLPDIDSLCSSNILHRG